MYLAYSAPLIECIIFAYVLSLPLLQYDAHPYYKQSDLSLAHYELVWVKNILSRRQASLPSQEFRPSLPNGSSAFLCATLME